MSAIHEYDAVVLGAGQAGVPLSQALARSGRNTALIEREHVGGTCVNEGCTPTKTMVASGRVAYLARHGADYGVRSGPTSVDMTGVRQRKRDIVALFRSRIEQRIEQTTDLEALVGEARFTGANALAVRNGNETSEVRAGLIFINVGARPSRPPIPGLDTVKTLDSTTIMELDTLPEHLLVLGGGYVGLEFGQMFRRFGSQVTIIQRGPRLLGREDADIANAVAEIMRDDGIQVLLLSQPTRVEQGADGFIRLRLSTPDGERLLEGSHLLVAAGRIPNTDRLALGAAGVATDQAGYVRVNERLETNIPGIYALGDVKGGPAFTHISYDDFRIIRTNLIETGRASTRNRLVPYTVFIDPQLGRIGLGEDEARARGLRVRVAKLPMNRVARALEVDETRGFIKAVVDADTDQILGAAVLGIEGGEIAAQIQIAMVGGIPSATLRDAIFAHPTLAESLNNLFSSLESAAPLTESTAVATAVEAAGGGT
jgi:pyruvate/2-oxoglutarate dehydrogenase complex dihydrolipoamide dehydrogenase (E3) component